MSRLVIFMSDFGWNDPYAGIVKGVIEKLSNGKVRVIDLTHDIPAYNIMAAAYILYTSYKYFPKKSVFLVVVDPGVGTKREPIVIKTKNYYFVGPNNGVLFPAASSDGIVEVRTIDRSEFFLKPVSFSFHGRDIFAPIATFLALDVNLQSIGSLLTSEKLEKLELMEECNKDIVEAKIVYIDHFGNIALGLKPICREKLCRGKEYVEIKTKNGLSAKAHCLPVFSLANKGELVFYINSLGFPEIAMNQGNAAEYFRSKIGDVLVVKKS